LSRRALADMDIFGMTLLEAAAQPMDA